MTSFFASHALLPDGWATNGRIEVDAAGDFSSVEKNSSSKDAARDYKCAIAELGA